MEFGRSKRVESLSGLIPVIAGFAAITWCLAVHVREAPEGWRIEKNPYYPTPAFLITQGPYRFSRNPIYVAEGVIWLGWIVFWGSPFILAVLAIVGAVVGPWVLRREEKGLEARFGEAWIQYTAATPRWLNLSRLRRE